MMLSWSAFLRVFDEFYLKRYAEKMNEEEDSEEDWSATEYDDSGVSSIIGTLLMLVLCIGMAASLIPLKNAISAEADAQADLSRANADAARQAAWCARHPAVGPPECDYMNGFECHEEERVIVCAKKLTERTDQER